MSNEDKETVEAISGLEFSQAVKFRLLSIYFDWRARGFDAHTAYYTGVIGYLQEVTK